MIVPVHVSYRELEEICEADRDGYAICDDYEGEIEISADEVEFDYVDLEDIVDEYTEDIIEILLKDHKKELERALVKLMTHR
ncbi:hypothetical protein [Saccharolobus islandicus]|uniref:Uncharacterized protein n=1 Tax=Saccharolobus islandicus (strain M.14.25 / Kamchatka \|nr:hypothetical protein [Sulfolobus islandicus]ACP38615.1 hypothetical protein M1425_1871 [Sulfolobus islandicus M.14.25]